MEKFCIGDRVKLVHTNSEHLGTVMALIEFHDTEWILIKYDDRWNNLLHDGASTISGFMDPEKKSYFHRTDRSDIQLIGKNVKRKINFDDDPFGEENYGFVQESTNNILIINIRDKYRELGSNMNMTLHFLEDNIIGNGVEFTDSDGILWNKEIKNVQIINNECYLTDISGRIYRIKVVRPIKIMVFGKRKRKINLEDDPFGEENYGFVQENFKFENKVNIKIDNIEEYIDLMKILKEKGYRWDSSYRQIDITGEDYKIPHSRAFRNFIIINNADKFISFITKYDSDPKYGKLINFSDFNRFQKRKFNLEDDPFGEDDWGFVQENNDTTLYAGDRVKLSKDFQITDDESEEAFKSGDNKEGTIFHIIEDVNDEYPIEVEWDNGSHYWYNKRELTTKSIKRKRKVNTEDDPFGEENYGFTIQESLNGVKLINIRDEYNKIPVSDTFRKLDILCGILKKELIGCEAHFQGYEKINSDFGPSSNHIAIIKNVEIINNTARFFDIEDNEYKITIIETIKYYKSTLKRKINLEDDPFGEENYGFVQENI